jgi:hypothetical protein
MTIYKTPKGINIYQGTEPTTIDGFFSILKETLIELKFTENSVDIFVKGDIQVSLVQPTNIANKIIINICNNLITATFYLRVGNLRHLAIRLNTSINDIDSIIDINIPEHISLLNFLLDFIRVAWQYKNDLPRLSQQFKQLQSSYP